MLNSLSVYTKPKVIVILLLGFSSGLPLSLTASTLDVWLTREGVSLGAIGLFAAVSLPYSIKFLWAPLVDGLPLPFFTSRFGRRRGWMVFTQLFLMASIIGLGMTEPGQNPWYTAFFALPVAFFSATQDIVIDAYRVEILGEKKQGAGAASVIFGYRFGMLISGAGALYLVKYFGFSWSFTYIIMAACILVGVITILLSKEPEEVSKNTRTVRTKVKKPSKQLKLWIQRTVIAPFGEFMKRKHWVLILLFALLFKLGDALAGKMTNPFLIQIGFDEVEIANVVKLYGFGAHLLGTFLGGVMVYRLGIIKTLWVGGIMQMLTNLLFVVQAELGHDIGFLAITMGAENLCGSFASIAFIAYISTLCNFKHTATQYALLSSIAVSGRTIFASFSGFVAEEFGWFEYFIGTTIAALPALIILVYLSRSYSEPELREKTT